MADIASVTINSDGWSADIVITGWAGFQGDVEYDFGDYVIGSGNAYLTCNSPGFASDKTPTAVGRTIFITDVVRNPGATTLDETDSGSDLVLRVSLSDEVYVDDTDVLFTCSIWANNGVEDNNTATALSATNSSTKDYPLPVAMWLTHDLDFVEGETFAPKLAVGHKFGRNKFPVACVEFTATDGTTTVDSMGDMDWTTYSASGLTAPHFSAALDFTALDPVLITVDATIYPWIGGAFTVSTDADSYPSPNLCVLKAINNYANGYGRSFAYVDSASGSDGTGLVSADSSTASASRYATIAAALTALQSFNNTNYSRNNVSGSALVLSAHTYTHASFSAYPVGDCPLVFLGESDSGTIYQDAGSTTTSSIPGKIKFKNLTLRKNVNSNVTFLDNNAGAGSANILITEDVIWSTGGHSNVYAAWIYRVGRWFEVNCSGAKLGAATSFGTVNKTHISIGCAGMGISSSTYHACATRDLTGSYNKPAAAAARIAADGSFLGWCQINNASGSAGAINISSVISTRGVMLVGSVFEKTSSNTPAGFSLNGDNDQNECRNACVIQCTSVGSRSNLAYQDTGSATIIKELVKVNNVFHQFNIKGDLFPTINAARVGNWAVTWNCGSKNNIYLAGSSAGQYGNNSWLGQVPDVGSANGTSGTPLVPDWVLDASFTGTNVGGGDYTPQDDTDIPFVSDSHMHYPVDLYGNAIATGSYSVGAVNISFDVQELLVSDSAASISMDAVLLSTNVSLSVSDLGVSVAMDSFSLAQANMLSIADAVVGLGAESPVLSTNSSLIVADSSVSVAMDAVAISQNDLLSVTALDISISADSPILIQQNALAINNSRMSILMDSMTIGGGVFVTESAMGMIVRDFQYVLVVEG